MFFAYPETCFLFLLNSAIGDKTEDTWTEFVDLKQTLTEQHRAGNCSAWPAATEGEFLMHLS
jgi:hypothetical protein